MPKIHIPARPEKDSEFLELIAKILFVQGFKWEIVDKRWPLIKKAFKNFDISKVTKMQMEDMLDKEGMIRNKRKIKSIIDNAWQCDLLIKEFGSMKKWSDYVIKKHEESPLLNPSLTDECKQFVGIGETTSKWLSHTITKKNKEAECVDVRTTN